MTTAGDNWRTSLKRQIIVIVFSTLTFFLTAQQSLKPMKLTSFELKSDQNNQLTLNFNPGQTVYSFLVFITDPDGNNIFLESKHKLTAGYLKHLDLAPYKKGDYLLTVIADEEKLSKKITLK